MLVTTRHALLFMALLALGVFSATLFSQYVWQLKPCAWCVLQRFILFVIALVCLLGTFSSARVRQLAAYLTIVLGISGMLSAFYQYAVVSKMLSCSQTFAERFMLITGLSKALPAIFGIYASCVESRKILGIDYEIWSLLCFMGLTLGAFFISRSSHVVRRIPHVR